MGQDSVSVSEEQIKQWAADYKRYYETERDGLKDQIKKWADDYERIFESPVNKEEQEQKLKALNKLRYSLTSRMEILDKLIDYIKNQLSRN